MTREEISLKIRQAGIFVILRKIPAEKLVPLTEALFEGGIRVTEITFNTPGAPRQLEMLVDRFSSLMLIGAGTIMTGEEATNALDLGAQFLVSPHIALPVMAKAHLRDKAAISGAMTPTEIQVANEAGADIIKLFPAGTMGVEYFRQIRGPFDKISFAAVGGITENNLPEFARAGASAFGIGSAIVDPILVKENNFEEIEKRARKMVSLARNIR